MRFTKTLIAASLIASGLSLAGCYGDDRPGHWGDHHGRHHDRDHGRGDHHHDRDHDWR